MKTTQLYLIKTAIRETKSRQLYIRDHIIYLHLKGDKYVQITSFFFDLDHCMVVDYSSPSKFIRIAFAKTKMPIPENKMTGYSLWLSLSKTLL